MFPNVIKVLNVHFRTAYNLFLHNWALFVDFYCAGVHFLIRLIFKSACLLKLHVRIKRLLLQEPSFVELLRVDLVKVIWVDNSRLQPLKCRAFIFVGGLLLFHIATWNLRGQVEVWNFYVDVDFRALLMMIVILTLFRIIVDLLTPRRGLTIVWIRIGLCAGLNIVRCICRRFYRTHTDMVEVL